MKELNFYEAGGPLTEKLAALKKALLTIKATCTVNKKEFFDRREFFHEKAFFPLRQVFECFKFSKKLFLKEIEKKVYNK